MKSKVVKFVSVLLVLMLLMGCVGFLYNFVNADIDSQSEFVLKVDDVDITGKTGLRVWLGQKQKIIVSGAVASDLTIKFVPHISKSTNFTFMVDGVKKKYNSIDDLTDDFNVKLSTDNFVVFAEQDLSGMIASHYSGKVTFVPTIVNTSVSYIDLVVTSEKQILIIPIYLCLEIPPDGLVLDIDEIIF